MSSSTSISMLKGLKKLLIILAIFQCSAVLVVKGSLETDASSLILESNRRDNNNQHKNGQDEFLQMNVEDDNDNNSGAENAATTSASSSNTQQVSHERCHWGTPGCHHSSSSGSGGTVGTVTNNMASSKNISDTGMHVPFVPPKNSKDEYHNVVTPGDDVLVQDINMDILEDVGSDASDANVARNSNSAGSIDDVESYSKPPPHLPPEGFKLSAHIITNPNDGLSYFASTNENKHDNDEDDGDNHLLIPFLECGAIGSTTQPIPLKSASFRHFPKLAHPTDWTSPNEVQLIVALHPLEITVSGNHEESRVFPKGSVILVEDILGKGHKMRAATNSGNPSTETQLDLSVLMLTLPSSTHHHHYHNNGNNQNKSKSTVGSLLNLFKNGIHRQKQQQQQPCKLEQDPSYSSYATTDSQSTASKTAVTDTNSDKLPYTNENLPYHDLPAVLQPHKHPRYQSSLLHLHNVPETKRRIVLTILGVTVSSLTSFFLAKVAPLQLAVGVGGACVIGGGTYGIVKGGERLCDELDVWRERRRLVELERKMEEEEQDEDIGEGDVRDGDDVYHRDEDITVSGGEDLEKKDT